VNGQVHAPAVLPSGKEYLVPTGRGGWVGRRICLNSTAYRKIHSSYQASNPSHPARSLVTALNELTGTVATVYNIRAPLHPPNEFPLLLTEHTCRSIFFSENKTPFYSPLFGFLHPCDQLTRNTDGFSCYGHSNEMADGKFTYNIKRHVGWRTCFVVVG